MLVKYDERTYPGIVSGSGGDAASEGGSGYVVVGSRPGANDLDDVAIDVGHVDQHAVQC